MPGAHDSKVSVPWDDPFTTGHSDAAVDPRQVRSAIWLAVIASIAFPPTGLTALMLSVLTEISKINGKYVQARQYSMAATNWLFATLPFAAMIGFALLRAA